MGSDREKCVAVLTRNVWAGRRGNLSTHCHRPAINDNSIWATSKMIKLTSPPMVSLAATCFPQEACSPRRCQSRSPERVRQRTAINGLLPHAVTTGRPRALLSVAGPDSPMNFSRRSVRQRNSPVACLPFFPKLLDGPAEPCLSVESDKLLQGFDLFAFVLGLLRQRAIWYFRSLASSGWDTADAEIEVPYVDSRAINGCTASCCNTTRCSTVQPYYIIAQRNVLL